MLQFLLSIADESDHEKVEYLYHKFHKDMILMAKSKLKGSRNPNYEIDAEDVVQNAFYKVTKHIKKVDFTVSDIELKSYMLRIVVNEANNSIKRHKPVVEVEDFENTIEDGNYFEDIRIQERYDEIINILKGMDDMYRIPMSLRYIENMTIRDISDLLGIAEKSVYTRIDRAKKIIVSKLNRR